MFKWTQLLNLFIYCCCLVTESCLTLVTPWTVAYQAALSMGFSRQEYWSGLPLPSPLKGMGQLYFNRIVLLKKSKVYGDSIVQDETCRSIA